MSYFPNGKFAHGRPLTIDYTPASAVSAGAIVVVGSRVGFADADIAANALGSLIVGGCAIDLLNDGSAFSDGQDVYYNTTNSQATPIGAGNVYVGKAEGVVASSTAGTTYTRVQFWGSDMPAGVTTNTIADPGAAGAIPLTNNGIVNLVSAAAETRTLAVPTVAGINLILNAQNVTAGTITVNSAASNIGSAAHTHIALTANGQSIELLSVATTSGGFRWAQRYNDGTTLS